MTKPWEKYQTAPQGPWTKYQAPAPAPTRGTQVVTDPRVNMPAGSMPAEPPSMLDTIMSDYVMPGLETTDRFAGNAMEGLGIGFTNLLGTPANVASAAPLAVNLLPGEQGAQPMNVTLAQSDPRVQQLAQAFFGPLYPLIKPAATSDGRVVPAAGSDRIQDLFGQGFDAITDATGVEIRDSRIFEDKTMPDRFAQRIGEEVGYTLPVLGPILKAIMASGTNLASRAATTLAGRELGTTLSIGATAQAANEVGERLGMTDQNDDRVGSATSDLIGSFIGSLGLPVGAGLAKAGASLVSGIGGGVGYLDDIAQKAVRDLALANSMDANRAFDETGTLQNFDTTDLVNRLRSPALVEDLVPGYRASTGQRLQDPMMLTMEDSLDASSPGASNVRRVSNNEAVNSRVTELAPTGDPATFRAAIQQSVDQRLAQSQAEVGTAQAAFNDAVARLEVLEDNAPAVVRGGAMREGLEEVYRAELKRVSEMMEAVEKSGAPVDLRALKERFDAVTASIATNDRVRFAPGERETLDGMIPEQGPANAPIGEAMAIRGGISSDIRAAADEPRRQLILGQYRSAVDDFMDESVPEDLRDLYREATELRANVGSRFESQDNVGRALARDGRGNFTQRPEQIPGALVPASDAGNVTDYAKMMQEAGTNPRVRQAVEDTVSLRAQKHLNDPIAMARFIDQNNVVLSDFPGLRDRLQAAGASRQVLTAAENASAEVTKRLTTPGRSPEASFLRFDDGDSARAMRTVISSDRPAESAKQLLDAAGRTPAAVDGAKKALWNLVTEDGQNSASLMGQRVWNPRMAAETMRDPKVEAAAREIWGADYQDFETIRSIFEELEASRAGQLRSAGNPAGTAAAVAMSPGARLSPARVSADLRAVSQNRTSPIQVAIQWTADKLRNMSAERQQAWIDRLMRASIDDPGRLANILERYNPALESMANRNVASYRGVRGSQVNALMEELVAEEDPDSMLINNIFGEQ